MRKFLRRHGEGWLEFSGQQIAALSTRQDSGPNFRRWSELSLYREDSGRHVLEVVLRSVLLGEPERRFAWRFSDPEDLLRQMADRCFDPAHLAELSTPTEPHKSRRHARHCHALRDAFAETVSDLLRECA